MSSHGAVSRRARAKVDTRTIDYSGYAPNYDAARFEGRTNAYLERIRLNALRAAVSTFSSRSERILDVGCGTGRGLANLGTLGFTNLTGLDYTHDMLVQSRPKLEGITGYGGLVRGSAFALPFPSGSFGAVTSFNFVHMFRLDLQKEIIEEMRRVCRPGGHLLVEFESVHKGLFFSRYLEQRRFRERTKFNSFWEIRGLFPKARFGRTTVIGSVFPKLYRVTQHWPEFGDALESLAFHPPFNWLAERVIVRVDVPA